MAITSEPTYENERDTMSIALARAKVNIAEHELEVAAALLIKAEQRFNTAFRYSRKKTSDLMRLIVELRTN